jgi:hypothetical protein
MNFAPEGAFTSMDPTTRQQIEWDELAEMPIVDDNGNEIPIYCENGFIIPRRIPYFSTRTPAHGMLMNLTHVKELFDSSQEDDDHLEWDDDDERIDAYVYPQAGLKTAGHYQANGLMRPFKRFLKEVNQSLRDPDGSEDGRRTPAGTRQVVYGIGSQGYNGVMHSTRGHSAQHHDAQLGMITGALAGSWAQGEPSKRVARGLQDRCGHQLPHKAFEEKIKNPNIVRDLRLENVYYVDVREMQDDDRNGRYVALMREHKTSGMWLMRLTAHAERS